jgi:TnpA family transposase
MDSGSWFPCASSTLVITASIFHVERGVTYYNFISDQFSGFHGIVIPGTLHDSPYVLDGLLEHQTELQPRQLMTDSAGYSDIVFGLFWLLGFQFSPRLAELGEARFWRSDPKADYGVLNGLARHRIKTALIIQHWDDLLRVAGLSQNGNCSSFGIHPRSPTRRPSLYPWARHRRIRPHPQDLVSQPLCAG